jgi:plasmid stabilization system protein ParE
MVKSKYEIIWDEDARKYFRTAIKYIKQESPQGAKTVRIEILKTVKSITSNPFIFEPDRFRKDNAGDFRAFTVFHFRITYRIDADHIQIVRMRHTSQEPLEY